MMRLGSFSKVVAVAATVIWVTGCSSTSTTSDSSDAMSQGAQDSQDTSASTTGMGSDSSMSGGDMSGSTSMGMSDAEMGRLSTVFYFDFDKAIIRSEAMDDLNGHARYLSENPSARVVLEGHADERGTREYNMALGERRAKAVARYLSVQGVGGDRIETVSYGEERPAVLGHDESAWSQNRRVELRYER